MQAEREARKRVLLAARGMRGGTPDLIAALKGEALKLEERIRGGAERMRTEIENIR
jgi:hypothetical protein